MATKTAVRSKREDLLNRVSGRLWAYEPVRSRDLPLDLSLSEEGELTLVGYAPTLTIKEAILDIAGSIDGVKEVKDEIFADPSLELAVAQKLSEDEATKHIPPGAVQVFAQVGDIVLVGDLKQQDREAVLRVAESVPGVRQVVDRMEEG
ncbi:MAG: BON domain-containing protein [Anaerolineales bacterium]